MIIFIVRFYLDPQILMNAYETKITRAMTSVVYVPITMVVIPVIVNQVSEEME